MAFDYNSRTKWEKEKWEAWQTAHQQAITALPEEQKPLYEEVLQFSKYPGCGFPVITKWAKDRFPEGKSLKEALYTACPELIRLMVPEAYREDFDYMLDQYAAFPYSRAVFRPTVRTAAPAAHAHDAFGLMQAYRVLDAYGVTPLEYLTGHPGGEAGRDTAAFEEFRDFRDHDSFNRDLHMVQFEDILAARIDKGDEAVIAAVKEAFLSDRNTVLVTVPLIRGVVRSRSGELHGLLAAFLLAARLQEGVRQAVCENADAGRPEAFRTILETIADNDLLRFSSVKRAVGTWTGIFNADAADRVAGKVFAGIRAAIDDRETALAMTRTDDAVQIVTGLWAIGFYEAEAAVDRMLEIAEAGTKPQRLAISYYNHYIQFSDQSSRAARRILELYPGDEEMAAAFMPTYLEYVDTLAGSCILDAKDRPVYSIGIEDLHYKPVAVTELFESEEKAREHYGLLKTLADGMKKRTVAFSPAVFQWYGTELEKSGLVQRMVLIAYALQDQALIDEVCGRLSDITDSYYNTRKNYLRLLLHDPKTPVQRAALFAAVADKESLTRIAAWQIVKKLAAAAEKGKPAFSEEEVLTLEKHLRLKNEETRRNVIDLLERQDKAGVTASMRRLLASGQEMMRLAGLDMAKRRSDAGAEEKEAAAALVKEILPDAGALSEKEKVLWEQIAEEGGSADAAGRPGYGLYDPAEDYAPALPGRDPALLKAYFSLTETELDGYFDRLRAFITEHGQMEYTLVNGEKQLLENGLFVIAYPGAGHPLEESYPFPELWREVYQTVIREPKVLFNLYMAILDGFDESDIVAPEPYRQADAGLFGPAGAPYHYTDPKYNGRRGHSIYQTILEICMSQQKVSLPAEVVTAVLRETLELPEEVRWLEEVPPRWQTLSEKKRRKCFLRSNEFRAVLSRAARFESDEEFAVFFPLLYAMDCLYDIPKNSGVANYSSSSGNLLTVYDYVKACELGIITRSFLCKAVFEREGLRFAMGNLSEFARPAFTWSAFHSLQNYLPVDPDKRTPDKESRFFALADQLRKDLTDLVLDVELRRGDTPTVFSDAVSRILRVEGIHRLMEVLRALGKDTLDRNTYYSYGGGTSRKECLCHLLKVCYPLPGETAEDLKKAIAAGGVTEDRMIEVAMYAPQWLELAEEALGIPGLTSGCYYFMAHMNERFDDRKKAVIARYTPLTPEELNNGCFDTKWFADVYAKLGEKTFAKLYKAAKYIADGSKHTRARYYADAATGKADRDGLEKTIKDKRSKDLLMSYGLIPLKDKTDALHRYEFIEQFRKESRQFGAQRRASETLAADCALKNMATAAGYSDELRLTMAMETELALSGQSFFEPVEIAGYEVRVAVDACGAPSLEVSKGGKALKGVPAPLKKDEAFLERKAFADSLKSQYSRCAAMFERAMEEEDVYRFGELRDLFRNPVTAGILRRVVFAEVREDGSYGKRVGTAEELVNARPAVPEETLLVAAHPLKLYAQGTLSAWQRTFFERQRDTGEKQPFRQVFREFYRKPEEELASADSRLFAGYQIQPKKTLAVLKGRRWVADYDEGLQKIFYKADIAVTLWALADWFSPADAEAPTLEYVSFSDRLTGRPKKLSDVPDVLYSEVMRDVDLAVSVAHVGGVDPETSHSTIEMRRVVLAFNIELFGLKNVSFEGTHAFIHGSLGDYTVQLGSGVVHKEGAGMINILPVHSQQRGRIFLPFVDEDPKTAEILSKILLLAEDGKIKDPYILEQIRR